MTIRKGQTSPCLVVFLLEKESVSFLLVIKHTVSVGVEDAHTRICPMQNVPHIAGWVSEHEAAKRTGSVTFDSVYIRRFKSHRYSQEVRGLRQSLGEAGEARQCSFVMSMTFWY